MALLVCTPWCTPDDLPDDVQTAAAGVSPTTAEDACGRASDLLYALSGRRWRGACERDGVRVELCPPVRPSLRDRTRAILGHGRPTGGAPGTRLRLPDYPVTDVTAVAEQRAPEPAAPVALAPGEWRVVDGRWLERLDAGARTWWRYDVVLDYEYGALPPDSGVRAAVEYASQLVWAAAGDTQQCKLPARAQTVTRQGITIALLDPADYLDKGRTGVPLVDQWLTAVNPGQQRAPSRVWSPDVDRTTTTYTTST